MSSCSRCPLLRRLASLVLPTLLPALLSVPLVLADVQPAFAANRAVSRDQALTIALDNAHVPRRDITDLKIQREEEGGLPVYKIEFETEYGDYDFCVTHRDGEIVDADYEVQEEWVHRLGGHPVSAAEVRRLVASRIPGARAEDIRVRREGDGQPRYEGSCLVRGIKYEFEVDAGTGIITDWNADLRR